MKIARSILNFYINSSVHVALAVISLLYITGVEFRLPITSSFYFFIFFGTITGYNFVKYAGVAGLHHRSLVFSLKIIQAFSLLCFVLLVFFMTQVLLNTLLLLSFFGFITFLYAVPFLPVRKNENTENVVTKNLRVLSGVKIFIVALVWAGTTVIAPVIEYEVSLSLDVVLSTIQRFFLVIVLILPFDIRDVAYDLKILRTMPQRFGIQKTKAIGGMLLIGVVVLQFLKSTISIIDISEIVFMCILTGIMLGVTQKKQSKYFASFCIESIPIIWCAFVVLFRHLLL